MCPYSLIGIIGTILALILGMFSSGCSPAALPAEYGETLRQTGLSIADQTDWDDVLSRIRGHVNNPGVEVYSRVELALGSRIPGVDGDVILEAGGHGARPLSDAAREAILEEYQNAGTLTAKLFWLKMLETAENGMSNTATTSSSAATTQESSVTPINGG